MEKRLLVKIAKELNVGTSTIVDHLSHKGFSIENKPTAKVTDDMYTELLKEFQKSIAIKEKADSLVIGTRPVPKKDAPAPKTDKPLSAPTEPDAPKAEQEEPAAKLEMPEAPAEAPKPRLKILGRVDLSGKNSNKQLPIVTTDPEPPAPAAKKEEPQVPPVAAEAPAVAPAPKPADSPAAVTPPTVVAPPAEVKAPGAATPLPEVKAPVPVAPPAEAKAHEVVTPPAEVKAPAAVTPPAAPTPPAAVTPPAAPKPEQAATPVPTAPVEPAATTTPKEVPAAETPAKPAATPPTGGEEMIRSVTPELRGLKILGKIDTDQFKRSKKKKEKPAPPPPANRDRPAVAGAGAGVNKPADGTPGQAEDPNKRKRKRKKVLPPTPGGAGNTGQGQQGQNRPQGQQGQQGQGQQGQGGGFGNRGGGTDPRRGGPPPRRPPVAEESKEVSKKEIEEKIKATMARLSGSGKKKRQKTRRDTRDRHRERQEMIDSQSENEKLQVTEFISVSELAGLMDVPVTEVIMACMNLGVIVGINQRLDAEVIELVANEFDYEVEFINVTDQDETEDDEEDAPELLTERAPIVTVMGHVDHGKTSLLDFIRSAKVAEGEAGGITQHIGAYEVLVGPDNKRITFLDTPGHEAFTAMRARGAKVTDIAVIIIAADDNIMPQTKEAISHAQAAGVPMVFAINKIDKSGAMPERIKQELASMNFLVEEWGGTYQSQDISAKEGLNIDLLLEKILLQAEVLELKANPDRASLGTVIEASLDKGRGYVTKVLVQKGTLKEGTPIHSGEYSGKIKAMFNERGKRVKEAGPSTPVLILGLNGAPQAGERFKAVDSEQEARQVASKRAQILREQTNRATRRISLDEIGRRLALGSFKELNLIIKGDVDGSIEALSDSLIKLGVESVQVNVIHKAVGQIIESDVLLASASDAIVIGFQVRPSPEARRLAEREGVQIKLYSIIYEAIEEIKSAIEGMLEPTKEERILAQVEVREVFKISKVGTIAGCYVQEGKITRNTYIRLIRDGIVVFPIKEGANGEIASLKRMKDDVKEVKNGMECGISIKNFNDIRIGDIIEGYEIVEIKQKLK